MAQMTYQFLKVAQHSKYIVFKPRDESVSLPLFSPGLMDKTANHVFFQVPVPSFDDFNRTGNISLWQVMRWCGRATTVAEAVTDPTTELSYLEYEKMSGERLVFTGSVEYSIDEAIYNIHDANDPHVLSFQYNLSNIGNSSTSSTMKAVDQSSGKVLLRYMDQKILVDPVTRRSSPIPEWWKQKYEPFVVGNRKFTFPVMTVPTENAFACTLEVRWSDIDDNRHTNYVSYVMFCFEAAMEAIKHGVYRGFSGDILRYHVKTCRLGFINESLAGDALTVVTWQDSRKDLILNFSIESKGKILFQSTMEFFPAPVAKSNL